MARNMLVFRIFLALLALASPFFFPIVATILITLFAAFFMPLIAIVVGLLVDTLYFGGSGLPYFTILGGICALAAYFVQQFIKTRII